MTMRWISTEEAPARRWVERTDVVEGTGDWRLAVTDRVGQTIKGFGGCFNELGWEAFIRLRPDHQDTLMAALFDQEEGCGFTFCRMPIGASDYASEWYSLSETPGDYQMKHFSIERDRKGLIPYIKHALAVQPQLGIFASPWSPPIWMKTRKTFNHGRLRWEDPVLRAYALYFRKFVEAYRAEGIPVEQVHVQNEPRSDQKFPSCMWTGWQMRDFIRDYLGPTFAAVGLDCEIWAGTFEKCGGGSDPDGESGSYADWAHTILSDPAARHYVGGIGYQWAGKAEVQRTHLAWPEVPIVQTENECGDGRNTWGYAQYVFDLAWHYLTNGAVAYTYWNMILPEGGASTWGWTQNSLVCIDEEDQAVYNPEFYVLKHFSHFVRPGAVRLEVEGPWAAFAVAFRNPDGSTAVVMANHENAEAEVVLEAAGTTQTCRMAPRSFNTWLFD